MISRDMLKTEEHTVTLQNKLHEKLQIIVRYLCVCACVRACVNTPQFRWQTSDVR